jgi:cellulose synthase operon protein YhjQ
VPLVLFTSPKGGVGKTTLAAHVAAILTIRGYRVIALDLDPQNALRVHLGLSIREEAGFVANVDQHPNWRAAVIETPTGVRLLPYGAADSHRVLEIGAALLADPELLATPVRAMLTDPGLIVIVDTAPGPSASAAAIAPLADLAVIVMLADAGSASLMPQVLSGRAYGRGTLAGSMAERAAIVLNQVDLSSPLSDTVMRGAAQVLGPRLLGAVCRDDAVAEALADHRLQTEGVGGAAEDLALLTDAIVTRLRLPLPGVRNKGFSALTDWGLT